VDEVVDTPEIACDPLAEAGNVVVVPLLVAEVEEAACNACTNGSVLDPLVLPESLLSLDAREPPIWA
jgi:hypothetical protein